MLELLRSAVSGHAEVLPGSAACRTGRGVVVKLLGRTPKAVQAALKVLHSLTIAGLSAAAALVIGTTELAGLTAQKLRAHGTFWRRLERININPPALTIGGMFLAV